MAFTVLMVTFVAGLFGLVGIQTIVPTATDEATVASEVRSMAVFLAAKGAMALLIIYLYYKVFDLAASLGGGLNMGNNMVNGVRSILRDLQSGRGRQAQNTTNSVSQGSGGGGSMASQRAGQANRTLTGMAVSAASPAVSAVGQAAITGARNLGRIASYGAGRAAGAVGRYAYNRNSQNTNRISGG
jgi:type IV secretory pathway VirJ component